MKLLADTADLNELKELKEMGLVSGVTTNPTIASRAGADLLKVLEGIVNMLPGLPIFGQVVATDSENIVKQARLINSVGPNMVVKLPAIIESVKAIRVLSEENIQVCATTILTAAQALLAARAGATYLSPYTGQNDIIGFRGVDTLRDIVNIIDHFNMKTQVIAASVEKPQEVVDYALAGAHLATLPYHVFIETFSRPMPLTQSYIDSFYKDWTDAGGFIKNN